MFRERGEGHGEERKVEEGAGAGVDGQKMLVRVVWRCADTKLLLSSFFLLFVLFILFPLLPFLSGLLPASDIRACLSGLSSTVLPLPPPSPVMMVVAAAAATGGIPSSPSVTASSAATAAAAAAPPRAAAVANYHPAKEEVAEVLAGSSSSIAVVKRTFNAVGSAAYLFIQMGAYRGGPNTFAVVGLASKPLHVFAKPTFLCEWLPHGGTTAAASVAGRAILPDWGYGRVYTAVVVNCTFPAAAAVGADGSGGRLVISASTGGGGDRSANATERIEALVEARGDVNAAAPPWAAPPRREYLYCGSPLYGNLSPQRVREWLAYHARLFGGHRRAHFVLYDAGGVHAGVMEVLRPWMEKGLVSLHDVREQERFDGYYHNQFLVVNDCLHRHRFAARWIFFFDLDEFLHVPPPATLPSLLTGLSGAAQFTIEQMPMSATLCLSSDAPRPPDGWCRMWGMEKLVYRDAKRGVRRDRKYAVRPRAAMATGSRHRMAGGIRYFHYHGTIAERREPCREFTNASRVTVDGNPFVLDGTLRAVAAAVKRFELKSIGPRLRRTPQ
ncbi:unnamed protein product [Spirodela intermedia]|uniref:Glycosyltransferase family 92 protein n=1 Tax=Spirodela intermedia TaxID=51605 RepID=A0A7I8JI70_SPIIN|nr:unnamed protein product [Spirodela intermedia]CAA6669848.1 unnamed protein product [Spirodela intermedia]